MSYEPNETQDRICQAMFAYLDTAGYAIVAIHPVNLQNVDIDQLVECMENAGTYELMTQEKERIRNDDTSNS